MEFKGTKGKWTCKKPIESTGYFYVNNEDLGLGQIATCYGGRLEDKNETAYNAKLISCAPEMLEMLSKIAFGELFLRTEVIELILKATTI